MDPALRQLREQIIASPDDVGLRRVYADRLSERGDPRGLFIQVQCELADAWLSAARRAELLDLESKLLFRNHANWIRPAVVESPRHGQFVRGFLERWACRAKDFIARGNRVARSTPLLELRLLQPRASHLEHVSRLRAFLNLRRLTLEGMTDWGSALLSPCEFTRLDHLRVVGKPRLEAGLFDLAFLRMSETRWFSRLSSFEMEMPMSPAFGAAVGNSPAMRSLKRLVLLGGLTRTLCPEAPAPALESLEVELFDDPLPLLSLFAAAPKLRAVTVRAAIASNYLRARRATPAAVLLRTFEGLPRTTQTFTLWNAALDEECIEALIASPFPELRLSHCRLTEDGLTRLGRRFPGLAHRGNYLVGMLDRAQAWLAGL
ncbi:MAG: TIGR02996 domain-containing protein [Myxococcaceae bacterium]